MRWTLLAALAVVAFLVGVATERLDIEPATRARATMAAAEASLDMLGHAAGFGVAASHGDRPMTEPPGAAIFNAAAMAPGLTLLAIGPTIELLRSDGTAVFHWRVPVERLFTLPALMDPADIQTSGLELLPDGSVLALIQYEREFPAFHWGNTVMNTALVKLDRESHLIWSFTGNPHHDVKIAKDGAIYALVAREGMVPPRPNLGLPPHFRDEGVAELDPDGHERRVFWLAEAIAHSPYAGLFAALDPGWAGCLPEQRYCWNLFHANSIQVIPADVAARLPFVAEGDLLISLREMDAVVVLDPKSGAVRWAMRGPWRHAHDAELTARGTLVLFDNRGNIGEGEPSRILEVDPISGATIHSYSGGAAHPFSSSVHGTKQLLPNGNLLITETMGGRVFEVTDEGAVVWQYAVAPITGSRFAPEIWGGRRIDPADYPFLADIAQ
ncbi:MAG: arylsulfotransferase family protein [Aliidongia sp.]